MTAGFDGTVDHTARRWLASDELSLSDMTVEVLKSGLWYIVRAVNIVKMSSIYCVFAHFLHVRIDIPGMDNHLAPVRVIGRRLGDNFGFPGWGFFLRVIPNKYLLINFTNIPSTQDRLSLGNARRHILGIGDVGALTLTIPAPAVKGTLNTVTDDTGTFPGLLTNAVTEVCAHVRTECINHLCLAGFSAKNHQFLAKVFNGNCVAHR